MGVKIEPEIETVWIFMIPLLVQIILSCWFTSVTAKRWW